MSDYVLNTTLNFRTSYSGKVVHPIVPMPSPHGFFYTGVQMALPLLIISSIKKVANKISRLVDNKIVGALGKTSTPDLKFQPHGIKVKSVVIFTTS